MFGYKQLFRRSTPSAHPFPSYWLVPSSPQPSQVMPVQVSTGVHPPMQHLHRHWCEEPSPLRQPTFPTLIFLGAEAGASLYWALDESELSWQAACTKPWPFWALGGGQGSKGWLGRRGCALTAMGSLFTCLQGSQPSEWVSGTLFLGLVSEDPVLWNSAPPGPTPYCLEWGFQSPVWVKPSRGAVPLPCKNSHANGFFKWSLLLLYKPSFKIDYKMFLNLPNTH